MNKLTPLYQDIYNIFAKFPIFLTQKSILVGNDVDAINVNGLIIMFFTFPKYQRKKYQLTDLLFISLTNIEIFFKSHVRLFVDVCSSRNVRILY